MGKFTTDTEVEQAAEMLLHAVAAIRSTFSTASIQWQPLWQ
ncbi:MAG: hypothetical protein Q6K35_06975 [Thermostichus sp. DG02_4_bins_136]